MKKNILLIGSEGYIGSYLKGRLLQDGYAVSSCDIRSASNPEESPEYQMRFVEIPKSELQKFDSVLWFAGLARVSDAIKDPDGALENNCFDLYRFARNLDPHTRFIYASTASLYSGTGANESREDEISLPSNNAYDVSKFAFDYISDNLLERAVGLRMATLAGFSPRLRPELIFNQMNISSMENNCVNISNEDSFRSILFIDDLYEVLTRMIESETLNYNFYNVGSINGTIGEFGRAIAKFHDVPVISIPNSQTYSFKLSTQRVREELNMEFCNDITKKCDEFSRLWIESTGA
jgi:UDP-glucose 4-epimerase